MPSRYSLSTENAIRSISGPTSVVFKATTRNNESRNHLFWGTNRGFTIARGRRETRLHSHGLLHSFQTENMAHLLSTIYMGEGYKLWRAEGDIRESDGLTNGGHTLITRELISDGNARPEWTEDKGCVYLSLVSGMLHEIESIVPHKTYHFVRYYLQKIKNDLISDNLRERRRPETDSFFATLLALDGLILHEQDQIKNMSLWFLKDIAHFIYVIANNGYIPNNSAHTFLSLFLNYQKIMIGQEYIVSEKEMMTPLNDLVENSINSRRISDSFLVSEPKLPLIIDSKFGKIVHRSETKYGISVSEEDHLGYFHVLDDGYGYITPQDNWASVFEDSSSLDFGRMYNAN